MNLLPRRSESPEGASHRAMPLPASRLSLVPPQQHRPTAFALWHLLSLDAPTVAALWVVFLAHCCGLSLPRSGPAAMFVGVWMLYAADRLLDALSPSELEERHRFHHRHRAAFLSLITFCALALAFLLLRLDTRALKLYSLLATLLAAWLLLVHARPSASTRRLPKEFAVGIFFSAAVFIPTVVRAPSLRLPLLYSATLFAAVCTLNCLCIYAWEHERPRLQAHWTTRWATSHLRELGGLVVVLALVAVVIVSQPYVRLPAAACAGSTLLLLLLDANQHRFAPVHLRAAADLALLTPLLLWSLS
jgi:Na+/H+ antiporter NhaD/arsenite permease-like protein